MTCLEVVFYHCSLHMCMNREQGAEEEVTELNEKKISLTVWTRSVERNKRMKKGREKVKL